MPDNPLLTIEVGDEPDAWSSIGFHVDEQSHCRLGDLVVRLTGASGERGLLAWSVAGDIDGLASCPPAMAPPKVHNNGVTAMDHVVVMTPNCDRTTEALEDAGYTPRGTRRFPTGETTTRQTFFWVNGNILEVVGDDDRHGSGPAKLWGLAVTCADFEASMTALDAVVGPAKDAVQRGRRIASLGREVDSVSVPLAFMSPHVAT